MICYYQYVGSSQEASLVSPRYHRIRVCMLQNINVCVEYLNLGFSNNFDEETVITGYKKHIAYLPRRELV